MYRVWQGRAAHRGVRGRRGRRKKGLWPWRGDAGRLADRLRFNGSAPAAWASSSSRWSSSWLAQRRCSFRPGSSSDLWPASASAVLFVLLVASDWTEESRRSRSATHDGGGRRHGKAWRLLAAASREQGALLCFLHGLPERERAARWRLELQLLVFACWPREATCSCDRWMKKEQKKIREREDP